MNPKIYIDDKDLVPIDQISRYFGFDIHTFMRFERDFQIYLIREYYMKEI